MSSDSVGGTGAANSNQPRGVPQRHGGGGGKEEEGEINMKRKGEEGNRYTVQENTTHTEAGGPEQQRLRREGWREEGMEGGMEGGRETRAT